VRNLVYSAELLTVRTVNIETVHTSEPSIGRSQDREANGRELQFSTSKTRAESTKPVPRTRAYRGRSKDVIEGPLGKDLVIVIVLGALQEGAEK
jgi:hypothetical protein